MRRICPLVGLVILVVSVLSSPKVHAANSNEQQVVVELFTSEGCSSCPPADKLLAELQNVDPPIIILSEHVDYWDYLGWRDPFSSPIFTRRQQLYSKVFDQKSLYTPQMVVDGTFAFVGTDGKAASLAIGKGRSQKKSKLLFEAFENTNRNTVDILVNTKDLALSKAEKIIAFLTEAEVNVPVKAGENSGRVLSHVGVVRAAKIFDSLPRQFSFSISHLKDIKAPKVVILRQNMDTMQITGAGSSIVISR